MSYKLLPDGGRRVIDFPLPGDVMGLQTVLLRPSDNGFNAVTVGEVPARQLVAAFEQSPRLAVAFPWAASRGEAITIGHLVEGDIPQSAVAVPTGRPPRRLRPGHRPELSAWVRSTSSP